MPLITPTEIILLVLPNSKIDIALLSKDIELAEELYIKTSLGKILYEKLLAGNLNPDHTNLLNNFVKQSLARYIIYEALPVIYANITSQGVMINDTDFSSSVTFSTLSNLRNSMLSKADFYRKRMIDFIKDNIEKFPDYKKNLDKHKNKFGIILD